MTLGRKLTLGAAFFLACSAIVAIAGWNFLQQSIALHAHAPHLTRIAEPAEELHFQTLDGQPQLLSALRGKVVFLDLWGTWCLQCVAEMPSLQSLYDHYRHDPDVVFLVVSRLDSPATVRRYAARKRFDLPFYTMNDDDIPPSMRLNQFPSTFLLSPDGNVAANHVGAADWDAPSVFAFIDSLKR